VTWVMAEAALCGQRGVAATNAAMAFETARTGHPHPTIIAANRAQLAAAVASNFLGVNTPVIAALEAQYVGYWEACAVSMYGYAGAASAITGSIIPDLPAATTVNPAGVAAQTAEVGADAGQSAGQAASTVGGASSNLGGMSGSLGSAMSAASSPLSAATQSLSALSSPLGSMSGLTNMFGGMGAGMMGSSGLGGFTSVSGLGGGSPAVSASMGRGAEFSSAIGGRGGVPTGLSVPSTWAGAAQRGAAAEERVVATALTGEEAVPVGAMPRGAMPLSAMGGSPGGATTTIATKKRPSQPRVVPHYP
jgi:PPE-repeat protein